MCTLTYIPIPGLGKIVTANRDESPLRNARKLAKHTSAQDEVFFIAKEPLKGGTNIAISPKNRISVLLNGAFEAHKMGGSYSKSRGLLLLETLNFSDVFEFARESSLIGVEPFTLVDFQKSIREIRWDGNSVHERIYSVDQPHIWASAQLYSKENREKRRTWFSNLLDSNPDQDGILNFHFRGGDGDLENDLVMNRNGLVQTVSITQLVEKEDQSIIKHFDLVESTEQTIGNPY